MTSLSNLPSVGRQRYRFNRVKTLLDGAEHAPQGSWVIESFLIHRLGGFESHDLLVRELSMHRSDHHSLKRIDHRLCPFIYALGHFLQLSFFG